MGIARILIVEDEILVAREIETHVQEMAYEVVGITIDAEAALQQVTASRPDLVLIDINLPGDQDGIELANEICRRFQIPIVYVTAYADRETLERAKHTHPYGYVLKPFNAQDLRVAIELALFRQQTHAEPSTTPIAQPMPQTPRFHPLSAQREGLPPSKLQKVLNYIHAHLNQELSLDMLAGEAGMTTYYFARLFKQSTGTSAHQYVIRQRIERAKQLLQQSNLSIADIATACGFANPSHLALHFKRIVGVSPKRFRFF